MLLEQNQRFVIPAAVFEAAVDVGQGGEEIDGFEVRVHRGLEEVSRRESVREESFFGRRNGVVAGTREDRADCGFGRGGGVGGVQGVDLGCLVAVYEVEATAHGGCERLRVVTDEVGEFGDGKGCWVRRLIAIFSGN